MIIIIILLTVTRSVQLIDPASYILLQVPAQMNKITMFFGTLWKLRHVLQKAYKYKAYLEAVSSDYITSYVSRENHNIFYNYNRKKKTRKYPYKYLKNRACWIDFHCLSTSIRTKNHNTLASRHVESVMRSAFFAQRHQSSSSMRHSPKMRAKTHT